MSAVDNAVDEIDQALLDLAPKHEGLRDFSRLNLNPDTHDEVARAITQYDERVAALQKALIALKELQRDGHPAMDVREVEASVFDDLAEQKRTIDAAMSQFSNSSPKSLGLSSGAAEPKESTKSRAKASKDEKDSEG